MTVQGVVYPVRLFIARSMRWPAQPSAGTSRTEPRDYVSRRRAGRWRSGAGVNPRPPEPSAVSSGPGPDLRALRWKDPAAARCSRAPALPRGSRPRPSPRPGAAPPAGPRQAQIGARALLVSGPRGSGRPSGWARGPLLRAQPPPGLAAQTPPGLAPASPARVWRRAAAAALHSDSRALGAGRVHRGRGVDCGLVDMGRGVPSEQVDRGRTDMRRRVDSGRVDVGRGMKGVDWTGRRMDERRGPFEYAFALG